MIGGHPIDAGNDARNQARAAAIENTHGHQCHVLRDAVSGSSEGAGDVRAVAITIVGSVTVVDGGEPGSYSTGELVVRSANAGVDDVGSHAGACRVVAIGAIDW